jgi:hypothetical protein
MSVDIKEKIKEVKIKINNLMDIYLLPPFNIFIDIFNTKLMIKYELNCSNQKVDKLIKLREKLLNLRIDLYQKYSIFILDLYKELVSLEDQLDLQETLKKIKPAVQSTYEDEDEDEDENDIYIQESIQEECEIITCFNKEYCTIHCNSNHIIEDNPLKYTCEFKCASCLYHFKVIDIFLVNKIDDHTALNVRTLNQFIKDPIIGIICHECSFYQSG